MRLASRAVLCALLSAVPVSAITLATAPAARAQGEAPPRIELDGAKRFLQLFEEQVERARGKPIELTYEGREALERIRGLRERFPDDAAVKDLFDRARTALLASRGTGIEITPAMLAYRENEARIIAALAAEAEAEWAALQAKIAEAQDLIEPAFPTPDSERVTLTAIEGRPVVLTDVRYPDNLFADSGHEFIWVGTQSEGYYYIDASSRAWRTAYEAVRRFRRDVSGDLPLPWTVVGRITDIAYLIPDASLEPKTPAAYGWVIEPIAIAIDGRMLALPGDSTDPDGRFAGEENLAALKAETYTVTSIPDDASPEEVIAAFATAIKEKNYDLFRELAEASWTETPTAESRLRYYWDNNQDRFRELYVHVEPGDVEEPIVLSGERIDDLEAAFLTEAEQEALVARAGPLKEQVTVWVTRYDERGVQVGSPNPIALRREGDGPWRVYSGFPL